jgi:hypothetical protein
MPRRLKRDNIQSNSPRSRKQGFEYERYFQNLQLEYHLYDGRPGVYPDGRDIPGRTKCWTLGLPSKDFDSIKRSFFELRQVRMCSATDVEGL